MPNSREIDDLLWESTIMDGDLDALRRLVDAGADIDHVRISDEINMPMLWLVLSSYWEPSRIEVGMRFVNFLIAAGADVNIRYGNNNSVLDYATNRGISTAVAALLEAGADVNFWYAPGSSFDQFKHSPVGMAVILGRRGILLDLLRAGAILPKEFVQKVEVPTSPVRKTATLSLAKRFVRVADDWAGFVRHHRGVLVSILGKCFGDALPHEVLAEVAAHWAPPGGS